MAVSASVPVPADLLQRQRRLIVTALVVLSAAGWLVVVTQSTTTSTGMEPYTMGMHAPLFIVMWIAMMVGMMFPTAAPMVLTFAQVHSAKRARSQPYVPTWLFVSAYLLLWTAFGVLAYVLAAAVDDLVSRTMWAMDDVARAGGAVLVLAGGYQLSAAKRTCLVKCRSPLHFIMTSWRDGPAGSFRMGLEHGVYCLGCCWLLFVILFPLGIMNVGAMVAITLLVYGEKSLPWGRAVSQAAGMALVAYGTLVLFLPDLLPTTM